MIPLPIMEKPFQRIAMDLYHEAEWGTLQVHSSGVRLCHALSGPIVDAEHVAEALMEMFSRVGVRNEILTDQGTNFISKLMIFFFTILFNLLKTI